MLCIYSPNDDPHYHLAAEEYFLRHTGEEVFMLWQSQPAVVSGKHQNVLAEINYPFVSSRKILIARRLSGGGTVYHDNGNINFTFIRNGTEGRLINFTGFVSPVISFLASMGVKAYQGEKNDILVNGLKISGNAEHIYKKRVLHHGTLLFDANTEILDKALQPGTGIYTDKAVKSNRSSVTNLITCLGRPVLSEDFKQLLFDYIKNYYNGRVYTPSKDENNAILGLADKKFRTREWIYGWSPDYSFTNNFGSGHLQISLTVHKGIMKHCSFSSNTYKESMLNELCDRLQNVPHEEQSIFAQIKSSSLGDHLSQQKLKDLTLSFLW